jgi:alpha-glucosidase
MVGSDICGFNGQADEILCARWTMLGAFQPFYRNHAADNAIHQEFYVWPLTIEAAKKAIDVRYKLLDYAYTNMHIQATQGLPMASPVFFLYPKDANTFNIQDQWFWGDALLISPVTSDYSDTVTFYLPEDRFYDYWTHQPVNGEGKNITIDNVAWTDIPVHIRGGSILPERVESGMTTTEVRKKAFKLIVAPTEEGKAQGRLYLDDGVSLEQQGVTDLQFRFESGRFSVVGQLNYAVENEAFKLETVVVLGQAKPGKIGEWKNATQEIVIQGPGLLIEKWGFDL